MQQVAYRPPKRYKQSRKRLTKHIHKEITEILKQKVHHNTLASQKSGGADRDRTGGLLVANQALSQLSYSPIPQWSVVSCRWSVKP